MKLKNILNRRLFACMSMIGLIGMWPSLHYGAVKPIKPILVSVNSEGQQGDDFSYDPHLSSNGNYIAFISGAGNLVPNDQSSILKVLRCAIAENKTELAALSSGGEQAVGLVRGADILDDGQYVGFVSDATNLVTPYDPPPVGYPFTAYRRDFLFKNTRVTSISQDGTIAGGDFRDPRISGNGRYMVMTDNSSGIATNTSPPFYYATWRYDILEKKWNQPVIV